MPLYGRCGGPEPHAKGLREKLTHLCTGNRHRDLGLRVDPVVARNPVLAPLNQGMGTSKELASNNYLQMRESLWKFRFPVKCQNTTEAKKSPKQKRHMSLDALEKVKGTLDSIHISLPQKVAKLRVQETFFACDFSRARVVGRACEVGIQLPQLCQMMMPKARFLSCPIHNAEF